MVSDNDFGNDDDCDDYHDVVRFDDDCDDYHDVVRYFENASEEEKSEFRKVLREGRVTFTPKSLASLKAKGLTEEDAIAMIVKATKSDN